MNFIFVLIGIILLALLIYGVGFILKKRHFSKIDELETRKIALMDKPVIDEINKIKKLQLTGQTEKTFKDWKAAWENIATVSFPDIENYLFDAEQATDRLKLIKAQKAEDAALHIINETEESIKKIQLALKKLIESEEKNRLEIKKVQEKYQDIRKKLLTQSFSFGPALENLERRLTFLELDFSKFTELTSSGDHIEAKEVLDRVSQDTNELHRVAELVPTIYKELTVEDTDQVKEIKEGYQQLIAENYRFLDIDIPKEIAEIERAIELGMELVEKVEVDEAKEHLAQLDTKIDHLYDVMENEIDSKAFVLSQKQLVSEYLDHVIVNNRKLLIEIDRVSQSYTLNQEEAGTAGKIESELEDLKTSFELSAQAIAQDEAIYSVIAEDYEKMGDRLEEIEKKQQELNSNLLHLRKEEMDAQAKLDEFEFEMRGLKRYVEKQHLPGLPHDYLELFFATTNRIEQLAKELNKLKIDMKEITRLCFLCQDDVTLIREKTEEIVDSALLTEYMMQYANRYRHSNEGIAQAIDDTLKLFNHEFQYKEALETISTTLESAEPGAYKKVESSYFEDKEAKH
ncbi:septation ring formation regulator EzrA [Carnobacterium divergens]|uniref:septation ring formation regulator EzrA n=1 Tax=Carnobacterium divergens TaxID=2748 RepID=UPI0028928D0B|nr:septation ring formation regulator EzrA [Carnobacterium divergens]MDT2011175.1 septation ring formation regulator EzrA [Carnobacterium divergens]